MRSLIFVPGNRPNMLEWPPCFDADVIMVDLEAMVRVQDRLEQENMRTKMLLQVHDEPVFETPRDELDALQELVFDEMPVAHVLDVSLKVETKWGYTWGDME